MLILVSYTSEIINKTNQDHKFKVVVISINCKAYVNVLEFLDVTSIIAYIVMSTTVYKYMYWLASLIGVICHTEALGLTLIVVWLLGVP